MRSGKVESQEPPPKILNENVSAITAMEKRALDSRTQGERFGDAIARQAGRLWFITLHVFWFALWVVLNSGVFPWRPFDPYPYPFLTLVVSLESIFLSLFILMSQSRSARQADERAHLDLQINLLAEQESTKVLQMLQSLCEYHGLAKARDPEVEKLKTETKPDELLKELKESLPEQC